MKTVTFTQNIGNVENLAHFGLPESIAKQIAGKQVGQTAQLNDSDAAAVKAAMPGGVEVA